MLTQGTDYMRTQRKHATYHLRTEASGIQPDALQSWAVKRLTGGRRNHQTSPPLYPLETTQCSLSTSSAEMSQNILWAAHFHPSFGACPPTPFSSLSLCSSDNSLIHLSTFLLEGEGAMSLFSDWCLGPVDQWPQDTFAK